MQILDGRSDERCFGCGDIAAFCNDVGCADVLQAHENGDHSRCDVLVCGFAGPGLRLAWNENDSEVVR